MKKPKVFIASSVEGVAVAYETQTALEHNCDPTVWPQGVFRPSTPPLDALIRQLENSDFAIFVFTPDDEVTMREATANTVRDNVIFELGLFLGRLGRERCFIIAPNVPMHIPTDLVGVSPVTYSAERDPDDLAAALGPACHQIRLAIGRLGRIRPDTPVMNVSVSESDNYDDDDKAILLRDWLESALTNNAYKFHDVDSQLKLDRGTAKRLLKVVIEKMDIMQILEQSNHFFTLAMLPQQKWSS